MAGNVLTYAKRVKNSIRHFLSSTWREYCWHLPITRNKVFFESYAGNGLTCSPEAIFRYLAREDDAASYSFVWSVADDTTFDDDLAWLRTFAGFRTVRRGTPEYFRQLYTSEYLVTNMSFAANFVKRSEQTYVNTWHGVPLKKMGYEVAGHIEDGKNVMRNFLAADYLLSNSPEMTKRMYVDAYKLTNVFNGTILEEGNPRTDKQHDRAAARRELDRRYPLLQLKDDGRQVVLYAPTWRGADYANPTDPTSLMAEAVAGIEAGLDQSKYRVLVKAHQNVEGRLLDNATLRDRLVPRGANANLLLGITDVLVTDYSSIFYDFVGTGRPIVHFVPDITEYAEYRDVYDPVEDLPGRVAQDGTALARAVDDATSASWKPSTAYAECASKFAPNDDGHVLERVVGIVFHGETPQRAVTQPLDGRQKILIYVGPLNRNGITSAARNLLSNIDYERFDVTVLVPYSETDEECRRVWNQLDPRVRVLFRFGGFTGTVWDNFERNLRLESPRFHPGARSRGQKALWHREWHRLFGQADFDAVIDFTGYAPFWGSLFQASGAGLKVIWQHNDMASDAERSINGVCPLRVNLRKVFQLYQGFDKIVSVSEQLMHVNKCSLGTQETADRFDFVPNTLDLSDIRHQADAPAQGWEEHPGIFQFINVGRMSPEKNQLRLIRAFAHVHRRVPNTRLVFLGDGPYRGRLESEARAEGICQSVLFPGMLQNPFPAMRYSDCMVVSSNYEGQPMVILEALTLGVPVITTPFRSVAGAFPSEDGVIVEDTEEALIEAMIDAASVGIAPPHFNAEEYNAQALRQFARVLGGKRIHPSRESVRHLEEIV